MLLIHIAHSMNRLNLSHLTQFIGILLLCKTEMRRAVPSTQVTLHCQCQCSGGKCFHWRSLTRVPACCWSPCSGAQIPASCVLACYWSMAVCYWGSSQSQTTTQLAGIWAPLHGDQQHTGTLVITLLFTSSVQLRCACEATCVMLGITLRSVLSTMIFSVDMKRSTSVLGCDSPSGACTQSRSDPSHGGSLIFRLSRVAQLKI